LFVEHHLEQGLIVEPGRAPLLRNEAIRSFYGVNEVEVLADANQQEALFNRVFPPKVDLGARRPSTFVWMLLRTQDGTEHNAPRELIHLLSAARDVQRRRLQEGQKEPPGEALFDRSSICDALPEVSRERLEQTLHAEYPHLRRWLMRLKRERTEQTVWPGSGTWIWTQRNGSRTGFAFRWDPPLVERPLICYVRRGCSPSLRVPTAHRVRVA
jgi:hypothetical protein